MCFTKGEEEEDDWFQKVKKKKKVSDCTLCLEWSPSVNLGPRSLAPVVPRVGNLPRAGIPSRSPREKKRIKRSEIKRIRQ